MNRNQAKDMLPIIQALAEGKHIQLKDKTGNWMDIDFINVELCNPNIYRIKPESKYHPFKDAKECWQEMQKHQPFGWVKSTLFKDLALVKRVTTLYVEINRDIIDYKDALEKFTFADGTPFGVKVEE